MSITCDKGDLALAKVSLDLHVKGWDVLSCMYSDSKPYDLVIHKAGVFYKIQAKHYVGGGIRNQNAYNNTKGQVMLRSYQEGDFDYYGLYIPQLDVCIYPHFIYGGASIRFQESLVHCRFYWYKDFLDITSDKPEKRSSLDLGMDLPMVGRRTYSPPTKIEWPGKEGIHRLVWSTPTQQVGTTLGVTDSAIGKYCKRFGVPKPPKGWWTKLNNGVSGLSCPIP
jgi:hypothetical protein